MLRLYTNKTTPRKIAGAFSGLCRLCGEHDAYEQGYGPEFGVCSMCAEAIANLYSYTHSGDWLTWANVPAPARRPVMPQHIRWEVLRNAGFTCQSCGATDRPLHVDHIIPLAAGGLGDRENLQCLCDKCNMKKGARL